MEPNGSPHRSRLDGSPLGDLSGTGAGGHDGQIGLDDGGFGGLDAYRDGTGTAGEAVEYGIGTTTVGLVATDGVVLATDRRASLGSRFVSNKDVVKVEQVHPTEAVTTAGSVGAAQAYIRQIRAEAELYESRRDDRMSMEALSSIASGLICGLPVSPLLGGVDPGDGDPVPRLYQLDGAGGRIEESQFAATGSRMTVATGALERSYEADVDIESAVETAVGAVLAASERYTASGNGVIVARVTATDVETERRDATGALMNGANGWIR